MSTFIIELEAADRIAMYANRTTTRRLLGLLWSRCVSFFPDEGNPAGSLVGLRHETITFTLPDSARAELAGQVRKIWAELPPAVAVKIGGPLGYNPVRRGLLSLARYRLGAEIVPAVTEYADEAEHQNGYGYWSRFPTAEAAFSDFSIYMLETVVEDLR